MTPGRELDALIAEKVMGWTPWIESRGGYEHITWQRANEREPWYKSRDAQSNQARFTKLTAFDPQNHIEAGLPRFSREIAAAWQVVERVWEVAIPPTKYGVYRFELDRLDTGDYVCEFATDPDGDFSTHSTGQAATAPLAICLAALTALGAEIPA